MTKIIIGAAATYISNTNTMSSDAVKKRKVEGDHHPGEDIVSKSDVGEGV